jgi:hypothetical protein
MTRRPDFMNISPLNLLQYKLVSYNEDVNDAYVVWIRLIRNKKG